MDQLDGTSDARLAGRTIAYFVHGRGRGHASRALDLVPALRAGGARVELFASGDALPVLGVLGAVQARPLLERGPRGWLLLARRARAEAALLSAGVAECVISDGDQAAILAARAAGRPVLALGHDLAFHGCELPRALSRGQLLLQRLNGIIPARLSTRRVAVSFLPTSACDLRLRVARPELRFSAQSEPVSAPREQLLCYFRDGNGTRAVELAHALIPEVVVTDGKHKGALPPARFRQLLAGSLGVIASSGSNLIAECVAAGTPLLALYRRGDVEQALNARWLEAAGAGMAASFERLDRACVARFVARARARDFARVALRASLPGLVQCVADTLVEMLAQSQPEPQLRPSPGSAQT